MGYKTVAKKLAHVKSNASTRKVWAALGASNERWGVHNREGRKHTATRIKALRSRGFKSMGDGTFAKRTKGGSISARVRTGSVYAAGTRVYSKGMTRSMGLRTIHGRMRTAKQRATSKLNIKKASRRRVTRGR